jgi:CRISPR system Cascade subunit CasE
MIEMTLHMIQGTIVLPRLLQWGHEQGLPLEDDDQGYLLHSALRAAFGVSAPQPFTLRPTAQGAVLYGYGVVDKAALQQHAAAFAEPLLLEAMPLEKLSSKPMPTNWIAGQRLGFEVRVCPVVRGDRDDDRKLTRETDAFIAVALRNRGEKFDRASVYGDWLKREFTRDGAAALLEAHLTSFRLLKVSRRRADRKPLASEKPEAAFAGVLAVGDPQRFALWLARGVGRHRAFGFGMLLLRPVR